MTLIAIGLALWALPHWFKRLAPEMRADMGDKAKGVVAVATLAGLVLMVLGYRGAEFVPVYTPMPGMGHANNTLMLISVYLFGVGGTKGVLYTRLRHPMLLGTVIWAVAHLLVNGDQASILLFGGMGLWALISMGLINRAGAWVVPANGRGFKGDLMNVAGTLLLFGVIAMVHKWLGHPVFAGTYY
jgi:uncharacterized membrane protein